jgi:hypothetical protein
LDLHGSGTPVVLYPPTDATIVAGPPPRRTSRPRHSPPHRIGATPTRCQSIGPARVEVWVCRSQYAYGRRT